MSVLELSDLVKALEEKFGVSAAATMVAAAPAQQEQQHLTNQKKNKQSSTSSSQVQVHKRSPLLKPLRELVPTPVLRSKRFS